MSAHHPRFRRGLSSLHPVLTLCPLCLLSSHSLIFVQCHLNTGLIRWPDAHDSHVRIGVSSLDTRVRLHQPRENIAGFYRYQHLSRAAARPAAEWHKVPEWAQVLPPFWPELLSVWSPNFGVAVDHVLVHLDNIAFADKNGRLAIGATANGEYSIPDAFTDLRDAVGEESVCWGKFTRSVTTEMRRDSDMKMLTLIQNRIQILQPANDLERELLVSHSQYFRTTFGIYVGSTCEIPQNVADKDRCGVVVGYEDKRHLRAQSLFILEMRSHVPEEVGAFRLLWVLAGLLICFQLCISAVNMSIEILMNDINSIQPGLVAEKEEIFVPLQPQAQSTEDVDHRPANAGPLWVDERFDGFAKEVLRDNVEKLLAVSVLVNFTRDIATRTHPALNERLYVECDAVLRERAQQPVNMTREPTGVGEGAAFKERFDQEATELPFLAVDSVHTLVGKWVCSFVVAPHGPNSKVSPVERGHGFHVFWLDGIDEARADKVDDEGLWQVLVDLVEPDQKIILAQRLGHAEHDVQPQQRIQVRVSWNFAASLRPALVLVYNGIEADFAE